MKKFLARNKYVFLSIWSVIIFVYGLISFCELTLPNEIYGTNFGALIQINRFLALIVVWFSILGITLFFDKRNTINQSTVVSKEPKTDRIVN